MITPLERAQAHLIEMVASLDQWLDDMSGSTAEAYAILHRAVSGFEAGADDLIISESERVRRFLAPRPAESQKDATLQAFLIHAADAALKLSGYQRGPARPNAGKVIDILRDRFEGLQVMAMADDEGWWYHTGDGSPLDYADPSKGWVHLGTYSAADSRRNVWRDRGMYRVRIAPRNPCNSPSNPAEDQDANRIDEWIGWGSPRDENGEPYVPKDALSNSYDHVRLADAFRNTGFVPGRHDAIYYRNGVEDKGSISVIVPTTAMTQVELVNQQMKLFAATDQWWYHFGAGTMRDQMGDFVHLGTRQAAIERMGETRQGGHGELIRAKIRPRNPLNSPQNPMSDNDANLMEAWEGFYAEERGQMPEMGETQFGIHGEPAEVAKRWNYQGAWTHDAMYYRNGVEDPGSISVLVDPDCIVQEEVAPVEVPGVDADTHPRLFAKQATTPLTDQRYGTPARVQGDSLARGSKFVVQYDRTADVLHVTDWSDMRGPHATDQVGVYDFKNSLDPDDFDIKFINSSLWMGCALALYDGVIRIYDGGGMGWARFNWMNPLVTEGLARLIDTEPRFGSWMLSDIPFEYPPDESPKVGQTYMARDWVARFNDIRSAIAVQASQVGVLYHGTDVDLVPGTVLTAQHGGRRNHALSEEGLVYLTPDPGAALVFAENFAREGHQPRVYEVEASGAVRSNPRDRFDVEWTAQRATVVREVTIEEAHNISRWLEGDDEHWPRVANSFSYLDLYHGTCGYYAGQILSYGLKPRDTSGIGAGGWSGEHLISQGHLVYLAPPNHISICRSAMSAAKAAAINELFGKRIEAISGRAIERDYFESSIDIGLRLVEDVAKGKRPTGNYGDLDVEGAKALLAEYKKAEADGWFEGVLLQVNVPREAWRNFRADEDSYSYSKPAAEVTDMPEWMYSLGAYGVVAYEGVVPSAWIREAARGRDAYSVGMRGKSPLWRMLGSKKTASRTYYHGTTARVGIGDTLTPGQQGNYNPSQFDTSGKVYLTDSLDMAFYYAVLGAFSRGAFDDEPVVFEVQAIDPRPEAHGEWVTTEATVVRDVTEQAKATFVASWDEWLPLIENVVPPGRMRSMVVDWFERIVRQGMAKIAGQWDEIILRADEIAAEHQSGGQLGVCGRVSAEIARELGIGREEGFYKGSGSFAIHAWNVLPNGDVLDATHNQWGGEQRVVVIPEHEAASIYVAFTPDQQAWREWYREDNYGRDPDNMDWAFYSPDWREELEDLDDEHWDFEASLQREARRQPNYTPTRSFHLHKADPPFHQTQEARLDSGVMVKFVEGGDSFFADQYDGWISAVVDGQVVGTIHYSIWEHIHKVQNIEVDEAWRRKGIATALFHRMMEGHPDDVEVSHSGLLPDGAKWWPTVASKTAIARPSTVWRGIHMVAYGPSQGGVPALRDMALAFVEGTTSPQRFAQTVLNEVSRGNPSGHGVMVTKGLGVHWTYDLDTAKRFGGRNEIMVSMDVEGGRAFRETEDEATRERIKERHRSVYFGIILEGSVPLGTPDPTETDPNMLWGLHTPYGLTRGNGEQEMPLRPGTPVEVTAVWLLQPTMSVEQLEERAAAKGDRRGWGGSFEAKVFDGSAQWVRVPVSPQTFEASKTAATNLDRLSRLTHALHQQMHPGALRSLHGWTDDTDAGFQWPTFYLAEMSEHRDDFQRVLAEAGVPERVTLRRVGEPRGPITNASLLERWGTGPGDWSVLGGGDIYEVVVPRDAIVGVGVAAEGEVFVDLSRASVAKVGSKVAVTRHERTKVVPLKRGTASLTYIEMGRLYGVIAEVSPGGKEMGFLTWERNQPKVDHIEVHDPYKRLGLATAMWDFAREIEPDLKHTTLLLPDGKAWVLSLPEDQREIHDRGGERVTAVSESRSIWEPPPGTTFFHGTDRTGADLIREHGFELPTSPTGRGADFGYAAYLTRDRAVARDYSRGAVVTFTLAPGTKILDLAYTWSEGVTEGPWETLSMDEYRRLAEAHGCHGVTVDQGDPEQPVAIFETSRLALVREGSREAVSA